ncbi:MAG: GNAT family N-acetyltransferase [Roseibium sp.]
MCTVIPITGEQTLPLRQKVLWPNLEVSDLALTEDGTALHLGLFHDGDLVGVGSFFPDGDRYRLRKMAVDPALQGRGFGARLVTEGMELLAQQGVRELYCDIRVSATSFYQRLGFEITGAKFDKNGVTYRKASRPLYTSAI